jgi:hypothetical protein
LVLQAEAADISAAEYQEVTPSPEIGLPFLPHTFGVDYFAWPLLPELFPVSFPGVKTSHDDVVVSIDKDRLIDNVQMYLRANPNYDSYDADKITRYAYRPLDIRWLYWDEQILDRARPDYFPHVKPDNLWIEARQRQPMEQFDRGMFTRVLGDNLGNGLSSYIPLYLYATRQAQLGLFEAEQVPLGGRKPNLSDKTQDYLAKFGLSPEDGAELLFYHTLAVLHSPIYRVENAGALRQDWPRVPLPKTREALEASAALGRQVATLLDVEMPVSGVTQGNPRGELQTVAVLTTADGSTPDFTINVNWGYFGAGSAVMPGRGRAVENDGLIDVYLNETTYWRGVPADVWEYTLGGYQVLKKWLSYRETAVLGRLLKPEEAREFMHIARRITALLTLNEALDSNYRLV